MVRKASELVRLYRKQYGKELDEKLFMSSYGYSLMIQMNYLRLGNQ